ncbi:hypothetical protein [Streptomyces sp. NPDC001678]|uniref:hypothetical protein n=1 Tax=Streptomyces sp. NPDC001678 TaxID=3364599 RepID=UPI0036A9C561
MATMRIYYDINVLDQPVASDVRLSLNGKDVTVTISHLSPFRFSVSPKGNIGDKILGTIAKPLADILGATVLPGLISQLVRGRSFTAFGLGEITQRIGGEDVTLKINNPAMDTRDGMLRLSSSLTVS